MRASVPACLLAWLVLIGPAIAGNFPVLGKDGLHEVQRFEDHSEALAHWAALGIRHGVLMNVDAHDDLRRIPEAKIERLRRLYQDRDIPLLKDARSGSKAFLYHIGNFIFAAARLGIIDRVYWVIPFPYFTEPDPEKALRGFLREYAFPEEDIRTFHLEDGVFSGRFQGVPLRICRVGALPQIRDPLILSVDVDFFPPFAKAGDMDLAEGVSTFFRTLFQKAYRIEDAFIAYSVNGGYLSPLHRWVGDLCGEFLERPERVQAPLPEVFEWKQQADRLYEQTLAKSLYEKTVAGLERFPDDAGLQLYAAFACYGLGETGRAYHYAKAACLQHSGYCQGLADIGQCFLDQGRVEEALPFFETAYSLSPGMNYRLKNLADALEAAGRFREARRYYEIHEARNGAFPAAFRVGGIHLRLGEETLALQAFQRGVRAVARNPYAEVRCPEDGDAVRRAAGFFEARGRAESASTLRGHPLLAPVFESPEGGKRSP